MDFSGVFDRKFFFTGVFDFFSQGVEVIGEVICDLRC